MFSKAKSYDQTIINLREEIGYLQQVNFRDSKYSVFNMYQWFKQPQKAQFDQDFRTHLRWHDLELFDICVMPIIPKVMSMAVYVRILTYGKVPETAHFDVYAKSQEDAFTPSVNDKCEKAYLYITPGEVIINDLAIDANQFLANDLTMMFGFSNIRKVLTKRVKLILEGKGKKAKSYEDLLEKRFYGMVDIPYISPGGARHAVFAAHSKAEAYPFMKKKREKLGVLNLDQVNQQWLNDYSAMSPYW